MRARRLQRASWPRVIGARAQASSRAAAKPPIVWPAPEATPTGGRRIDLRGIPDHVRTLERQPDGTWRAVLSRRAQACRSRERSMNRPGFRTACATALAVALLWPSLARASATFVIQNLDVPGQGFNDPTPAAPVGGNTGTTVGQQRLNAFKEATRIWGTMLDSYVPIVIAAQFGALDCSGDNITLGQARASGVEIDQPGSPPNILVPEALADRLAGFDLRPGMEDIDAQFNGALFDCSGGQQDWYYGFDGKPPGNDHRSRSPRCCTSLATVSGSAAASTTTPASCWAATSTPSRRTSTTTRPTCSGPP